MANDLESSNLTVIEMSDVTLTNEVTLTATLSNDGELSASNDFTKDDVRLTVFEEWKTSEEMSDVTLTDEVTLTATLSNSSGLSASIDFTKGEAGLTAFEEWKTLEGNEEKTFDDFLSELGGNEIKSLINYNRTQPTTISIGGVEVGTTFKGTIQNALDKLFYPDGFETTEGLTTENENMLLSENDLILENSSEQGVKISELPETNIADGFVPVVQNGETKKINIQFLDNYTNPISETIVDYKSALDYLLYYDLTITLNTSHVTTVEVGSVLSNVTFNWSYNKTILSQSFNGVSLDKDVKNFVCTENIINNKTFTLTANDERKQFSKSITFNFRHGRYWGTSSSTSLTNDDILNSLNKELSTNRNKTFTVTANDNEYIYYCYPNSWGTSTFSVGGFVGGFELVSTINFTNINNVTTLYNVYRSTNKSLGNTTVTVS